MRSSVPKLAALAAIKSVVHGQSNAEQSIISLYLGDSTVQAPLGVDRTSFSVCTEAASSEASLLVQLYPTGGFGREVMINEAALDICLIAGCTDVGLARFKTCCPTVISDASAARTQFDTGTSTINAMDCFSNFHGAATAAGTAKPTVTGSSVVGSGATVSGSQPAKTSAATLGSSPPASSNSPSSTSHNGATSRNSDVFASSALAIFIGLVAYVL